MKYRLIYPRDASMFRPTHISLMLMEPHMNLNRTRPFNASKRTSSRGSDVSVVIGLSLTELYRGIERDVTYSSLHQCSPCSGSGRVMTSSPAMACVQCSGLGRHHQTVWTEGGQKTRQVFPCNHCSGDGKAPRAICPSCRGQGQNKSTNKLRVMIPPTQTSGLQQLRVKGMGDQGKGGAPSGDLILRLKVHVDEGMGEIKGLDLVKVLPVSIFDALVGGEVAVQTPLGSKILPIPPGSPSGCTLRVKGGGVSSAEKEKGLREVGDARFIIKIVIPNAKDCSQAEIDLLLKLKQVIVRGL